MQKTRLRRTKIKLIALVLTVLIFQVSVFQATASEEENIDSFDVHPLNRWSITNNGVTASVANSLLNLTDTGDGTSDSYYLQRELSADDAKVEIRFKYTANKTGGTSDTLRLEVLGSGDSGGFMFYMTNPVASGYTSTILYFRKTDDTWASKTLSGDERVAADTWYRLKISYNRPKSMYSMKLTFDNTTKVFEYKSTHVSADSGFMSSASVLAVKVGMTCYTNALVQKFYIDYVQAKFKERDWAQTTAPVDADWLQDSVYGAYIQDDCDDESTYRLTVPMLDSVQGTMGISVGNFALLGSSEYFEMNFRLYNVDSADGTLDEIVLINLHLENDSSWGETLEVTIKLGGVTAYTDIDNPTSESSINLDFVLSLTDDRETADLRTVWSFDDATFLDKAFRADVSSIASSFSQEFVLEVDYKVSFTGNTVVEGFLDDSSFVYRESFAGIKPGIADQTSGGSNWLADIIIAIGRFLADAFKSVVEPIVNGLSPFLTDLGVLISTVISTLGDIGNYLVTVITDIGQIAGDMVDLFFAAAEAGLSFIVETITTIWTYLEDVIPDILDWIIAGITAIITDLIDLLAAIVFAVWDGMGLPNLLAIIDFLLLGSLNFIDDAVNLLTWVKDVLFFWGHGVFLVGIIIFWLVPVIRGKGDFGEFAESFFTMNSWNIMPFSVFGINVHLPVGFVFWPLLFMYVFAVTGTWA